MKRDTKIKLGKRYVVILSANLRYVRLTTRTIEKVKSADNGYERYYATIDGKRVEVVLNTYKVTGAAFALVLA